MIGCKVFRYCNTIPTSQIVVYLGKDGLPECPFKKSSHKGVVPDVLLSGKSSTDDKADLAVLMALYPKPCS